MSKRHKPNKEKQKFVSHTQVFDSYHTLNKLCGKESYCIVEPKVFLGLLPSRLLEKTNAAVVMQSEVSGSAVFTLTFNRLDVNASGSCIDLHSYIVAYDLGGSICKAGFIEHGDHYNSNCVKSQERDGFQVCRGQHIVYSL